MSETLSQIDLTQAQIAMLPAAIRRDPPQGRGRLRSCQHRQRRLDAGRRAN